MVPKEGIEPLFLTDHDFESSVLHIVACPEAATPIYST